MAEYIERENAYKLISEQIEEETGSYSIGRNMGLKVAKSIIHNKEQCPSADVVEVVRCGQCGNYCKNTGECNLYGRHPNENDFCSSGKKEIENK